MAKANTNRGVVEYCKVCGESVLSTDLEDDLCFECRH